MEANLSPLVLELSGAEGAQSVLSCLECVHVHMVVVYSFGCRHATTRTWDAFSVNSERGLVYIRDGGSVLFFPVPILSFSFTDTNTDTDTRLDKIAWLFNIRPKLM